MAEAFPGSSAVVPTAELPQGCCGCCWGRCPKFSWVSSCFLGVWAFVGVILLLVSFANWLLLPLVLLPALLILYATYWRFLRPGLGDARDDDLVLRMCAGGCVPGAAVAMLAEFVLGLVFFAICFRGQVQDYVAEADKHQGDPTWVDPGLELRRDAAFYANLLLNAYVTAAFVEEGVKVGLVRCQCCCGAERACCLQRTHPDPKKQAYMTIALLLAASVGFSTMENLTYALSNWEDESGAEARPLGERLLLAVARGAVSMPVHAICAAFTGLRLSIRDVQRRHRDSAALGGGGAGGAGAGGGGAGGPGGAAPAAPAFVMLPSGVVVQVVAVPPEQQASAASLFQAQQARAQQEAQAQIAQQPWGVRVGGALAGGSALPAAGPLPTAAGVVTTAASAPGAAAAARTVVVWGWPRVLWPALLVHGTFDFLLMAYGAIDDEGASLALSIVTAVIIVLASGWAVMSQLNAALVTVARGRVPERVTCAPVWMPAWLRGLVPHGLEGDDFGSSEAAAAGYAPMSASEGLLGGGAGEGFAGGRAGSGAGGGDGDGDGDSSRLLHAGVTVEDLRLVTDGPAILGPAPAAPAAAEAQPSPLPPPAASHPALLAARSGEGK